MKELTAVLTHYKSPPLHSKQHILNMNNLLIAFLPPWHALRNVKKSSTLHKSLEPCQPTTCQQVKRRCLRRKCGHTRESSNSLPTHRLSPAMEVENEIRSWVEKVSTPEHFCIECIELRTDLFEVFINHGALQVAETLIGPLSPFSLASHRTCFTLGQ